MRHTYLLLFFSFFAFASCKPKPAAKNGFDMPDVTTLKKDNNNSQTPGTWTPSYHDQMESELKTYANKNGIPASQVNGFTNCVISALEIKFPSENVDRGSTEAQSILHNCQKNYSGNEPSDNVNSNNNMAVWSSADQQEFLDNCTPGASKSLGSRAGSDYCNCMLKKLMQEYPNSKDVSNATQQHLTDLAGDCKKSVYD